MNNNLLEKAEEYVLSILYEKSSQEHVYHDVSHTQDVILSSRIIGQAENFTDSDLEIVQIAACFHDLGYVDISEGHEEKSAEYAREFLKKENYSPDKIDKVCNCILATKIPQMPKNILEEVICDADLAHLGKKNFVNRNDLFRVEFEFHFGRSLSEQEWLEKSIEFISSHRFFTGYAQQILEPLKLKHMEEMKRILENLKSGAK
jgi:predicted metal-dependent HD superfamily phosphohydrolase